MYKNELFYSLIICFLLFFLFTGEVTSNPTVAANSYDKNSIICEPRQGNCEGGDRVLMVINKLDRKKGIIYSLIFMQFSFVCFLKHCEYISIIQTQTKKSLFNMNWWIQRRSLFRHRRI